MNDHSCRLNAQVRVIKLGGSLLSNPETPLRIGRWLEPDPARQKEAEPSSVFNIWVVGGGELVDTVRDWDAKFSLEPEPLHWLCVDLMDINARLLAAWFPKWPIRGHQISSHQQTAPQQSNQILLNRDWLSRHENSLPKSWATTSDSIAAALADSIDANELVLLKSCPPPALPTLDGLACSDLVDEQFVPQIGSFRNRRTIRFVDFSNDRFNETPLLAP